MHIGTFARTRVSIAVVAMVMASLISLPGSARQASPVAITLDPEQWIVFQGGGRIQLVTRGGSDLHPLTPDWTGGEQFHPDWSPDGTQVAFSADSVDGTRDIWIVNVDGSGLTKVVDCEDPCIATDDPDWSADGSLIAYADFSSDNGTTDGSVRTVTLADGSITSVFEAEPGDTPWVPSWSPDGRQLVFENVRWAEPTTDSETVAGSAIMVIDLDATSAESVMVTEFDSFAGYPDWHPTQDLIVFQMADPASADGPRDLYTITSSGEDLSRLTTLGGTGWQAIQPRWAPNGESVIFVYDQMYTNPLLGEVMADGTPVENAPGQTINITHPRLAPGNG